MKPSGITDILLEKYLQGLCTLEEKKLVEEWYNSIEGTPDYLSSLDQETFKKLKEELFVDIQLQTMISVQEQPLPSKRTWWLYSTAACILLAVFAIVFYSNRNESGNLQLPLTTSLPINESVSFTNKSSKMLLHTLPDNSTVWLHPDARIDYPAQFDESSRKVTFTGEGFFDVKKDPKRPFSISTGEMTIRVLGTSFNVKATTSSKLIQVSVMTGSVEVSTPSSSKEEQMVVLEPKQHAYFEHESKVLLVKSIPPPIKKEIYEPVSINFVEQPLGRVVELLEKKFNVDLQLSDPRLSQCLFNGDFENQSLADILEMLCISLEASYTISDKFILINGSPCE